MFTDIAGYTALTQVNEERTLRLLKKQRETLRPIFRRYGGNEIKTVGDAFLVEFESALDATRCALEIQRTITVQNTARSSEALPLRIGIHLGDVVHTENDVLGDAVNIASRIESVAEAGGTCVSQQVYDQVWNKIDECGFVKLEGRQLKNVSIPIGVYAVTSEAAGREPHRVWRTPTRRVAVLPLSNFSPDPADGYIADAMTDELINSLSRVESLRVIARTSVIPYKNTAKSIAEIAGTLRVGSVVQGSILKSGNRVRITLQLVDAESEEQLWGNKYDRELGDIFSVQDDIARNVTESLKLKLVMGEAKPPEDIDAYTHYLRGRTLLYERTETAMKQALKHFDEAIRLDPGYARAYSGKADAKYLLGYFFSLPFGEACNEARKLAEEALRLDPGLAEAHATLGVILSNYDCEYDKAETEFKRSISLNQSYAPAHHWNAVALATAGRIDEAVSEMKKAEDADPLSPQISVINGIMLSWAGRDEEALGEWRVIQERHPDFPNLYYQRAMHFIERDEKELAMADVKKKLSLSPDDAVSVFLEGFAAARFGDSKKARETIAVLMGNARDRVVPTALVAHLYAALGDRDRFFRWADRAVGEHEFSLPEVRYGRIYSEIRADPRYPSLLGKLGLTA